MYTRSCLPDSFYDNYCSYLHILDGMEEGNKVMTATPTQEASMSDKMRKFTSVYESAAPNGDMSALCIREGNRVVHLCHGEAADYIESLHTKIDELQVSSPARYSEEDTVIICEDLLRIWDNCVFTSHNGGDYSIDENTRIALCRLVDRVNRALVSLGVVRG